MPTAKSGRRQNGRQRRRVDAQLLECGQNDRAQQNGVGDATEELGERFIHARSNQYLAQHLFCQPRRPFTEQKNQARGHESTQDLRTVIHNVMVELRFQLTQFQAVQQRNPVGQQHGSPFQRKRRNHPLRLAVARRAMVADGRSVGKQKFWRWIAVAACGGSSLPAPGRFCRVLAGPCSSFDPHRVALALSLTIRDKRFFRFRVGLLWVALPLREATTGHLAVFVDAIDPDEMAAQPLGDDGRGAAAQKRVQHDPSGRAARQDAVSTSVSGNTAKWASRNLDSGIDQTVRLLRPRGWKA